MASALRPSCRDGAVPRVRSRFQIRLDGRGRRSVRDRRACAPPRKARGRVARESSEPMPSLVLFPAPKGARDCLVKPRVDLEVARLFRGEAELNAAVGADKG